MHNQTFKLTMKEHGVRLETGKINHTLYMNKPFLNRLIVSFLLLSSCVGQISSAQSSDAVQESYQADELFLYEHKKNARKSGADLVNIEACIHAALKQGGVGALEVSQIKRAGHAIGYQFFRITAPKALHEEVKECLARFHHGKTWSRTSDAKGGDSADGSTAMLEKAWKVPSEFFDDGEGEPFIKGRKEQDVKTPLQDMGLIPDEVSTASYNPRTSVMRVRSTAKELDDVDDVVRALLRGYGKMAKKYGPVAVKGTVQTPEPPFVAALKTLKTKGKKPNLKADVFVFVSLTEADLNDDVTLKAYANTLKKANSGSRCVIVVLRDSKDISKLRKQKCKLPVVVWNELVKSDLGYFFGDPFMQFSLARGFNVYGGVSLPLCEVDALESVAE